MHGLLGGSSFKPGLRMAHWGVELVLLTYLSVWALTGERAQGRANAWAIKAAAWMVATVRASSVDGDASLGARARQRRTSQRICMTARSACELAAAQQASTWRD